MKRYIIDKFVSTDVTVFDKNNLSKMVNNLKDAELKKELIDKINQKRSVKAIPAKRGLDHHVEQVDYFCKDPRDECRFMTAWF